MIPTVKVDGMKELQRALAALPAELQRQSETTALREGMKPVLKTARALAPIGRGPHKGLLKKSIGLTVRKGKNGITSRVGARSGFKIEIGKQTARSNRYAKTRKGKLLVTKKGGQYTVYKDPSKYSHLVEYGTSHSAAKPFIRPAVESNESAITEGLANGYEKGMEKAIAKIKSRK
jgi:HK97 gp10 family phage protein